ncbi:MAG TPA: MBL fold metallo-hydrolase [Acidimicrobiales bacterium]|nr:MBL fold metallo-hydrolase [Acidimicrobiales bacterium]
MDVTFYGVRGSCPCPCEENQRYGGNTACVVLQAPGHVPIVLDLGTGLRRFAAGQPADGSFQATALVTHMHWDHVQGLPFFPPADRPGARFDVYGPPQGSGSFGAVFGELMRPPYFPVRSSDLRGSIDFHDVVDDDWVVGDAKIRVRPVPHVGPTVGYRVEWGAASVAYVSDHQAPRGLDHVADTVLELADGVDLLIHDAQYSAAEFAEKAHWGHCPVEYAVRVARLAGARRLVLFHHDPAHSDQDVDALLAAAREHSAATGGPDVDAAYEVQSITL